MEEEAVVKNMIDSYGEKLGKHYEFKFPSPSINELSTILYTILSDEEIQFPNPSTLWKKMKKSDKLSKELRELGNDFLKKQEFQKALVHYSKALIYSERKESKTYALALANRSVVLTKLNKYSEAIEDAEKCLKSKEYPEEYKLYLRQAKSFEALGQLNKALEKYECAKSKLLKTSDPNILSDINKSVKKLKENLIVNSFTNLNLNEKTIKSVNPTLSRYLNPKVEIKHEENKGRYAVAKSLIDVGEQIVVDEAATRILQPWYALDHCFSCLSHTLNPIPCEYCVSVVFCSDKCIQESQSIHSNFDCQLGILDSYASGNYNGAGHANQLYMAFKLLSVKETCKYFVERAELFSNNKESIPMPTNNTFEPYLYLYNMVGHVSNFWQTVAAVLFIIKLLEIQGFFDKFNEENKNLLLKSFTDERSNVKVFIGCLIYRFYSGIISNNHSISEVSSIEMSIKLKSNGLAVFPLAASIFNHSCDPNTAPVYTGPYQITIATRPILPGESICHVYQGHFADTPKSERQIKLKNMFNFECLCEACINDYPVSQGLKSSYSEVNEDNLIMKLSRSELQELDKKHCELSDKIQDELLNHNNVQKALDIYMDRIRIASRILKRPHMIFVCGRAAMSDCLYYLYSNKSKFINDSDHIKGVYKV
ncbi:SET and MYND domain-containing protein 4 isoform X1 [Lepeophtheirus salmonis]|uniref:SET and MYND domain-containing protein 4 isoform X1 n=1 Tax=Lepeophtheirus salmonis TaxID=72036 RepID=UPI001AEA76D2|nr:SET and MYND domain-containing protein 4-like isoform X1 [Lepeophtheirus salmonis]